MWKAEIHHLKIPSSAKAYYFPYCFLPLVYRNCHNFPWIMVASGLRTLMGEGRCSLAYQNTESLLSNYSEADN